MKKLAVIVLLVVWFGSVAPVFARSSLDALYVSAQSIPVPDCLAQVELPQSAKAWQSSWKAREEFFGILTKQTPVEFVYETEKIQVKSSTYSYGSQHVETLSCPFSGWLYLDDAQGFDYIVMMRKDFDEMEASCKVGIVEMVVSGYAIDLQTFRVESGVHKGKTFVKEGNKLNRRFYEVKGKKYTVIIFPQTDETEKKK